MAVNSAEYITLQRHVSDVRLAVKADLIGVSGDLLSKFLITKANDEELRDPMHPAKDRAARLVGFIQDKVEQDPKHYHSFIDVLKMRGKTNSDILRKLQDTYSGQLTRSYSEPAGPSQSPPPQFHHSQSLVITNSGGQSVCHPNITASRSSFEREESLDGYQNVHRLNSTASGSSFERGESLDEVRQGNDSDEDTQAMIQTNLETIKDHFANLIRKLRAAFGGIEVAEVHQYLIDTLQCDIPESSDLQVIFNHLSSSKLWSYQHHDLVEKLDKNFLQQSIEQDIIAYKGKLAGYFVAKKIITSEFFKHSESESTTQLVTEYSLEHRKRLRIRLKLKRKISDECLNYIADLWNSLAVAFELPSLTAVIDKIVEKCLEITWLILPSDAERIRVKAAAVHSDFYQKHMITLLAIDNHTIYEMAVSPEPSPPHPPLKREAQVRQKPCLNYMLLGECRFGDTCVFEHATLPSSPVTVYVRVEHQKPQSTRYGWNPSSGKGFIVVKSDREPTKEVKVVAEDHETAEYAKKNLPLDKKKDGKPRVQRECANKKLFGKCRNKSCNYIHGGVKPVEKPKADYFRHPMGLWTPLKKIIQFGLTGYTEDDEVFKVIQSDRDPHREVKVLAESDEALEYAKRRLTVITGRKYAERYIMLCYIHPDGVKETNLALEFRKCPGREVYSIDKVQSDFPDGASASKSLDLALFADLHHGDQYPESVSKWLDNPQQIPTLCSKQMRFEDNLLDDIHDKLQSALVWTDKEAIQVELKGRFGKLNFTKVQRQLCDAEGCDASKLISYLFENKDYERFFNIKVSEASSSALVRNCLVEAGSTTETYELKLGVMNEDQLEVHLKFVEGRPEVIQLKTNDSRILMVDVMCLNHEHDMRLQLSGFKIIPADDPIIHDVLSLISMSTSSPNTISLVPLGTDREWTVTILRQKTRKAYYLKDPEKKNYYLVVVCAVREYRTRQSDLKPSDAIDVNMDKIKEEMEVELHNLKWEVMVANQFGQSPAESLALLMEPDKIPQELLSSVIPDRWSPEMIMKEFKSETFLQEMYNLNKSMDVS